MIIPARLFDKHREDVQAGHATSIKFVDGHRHVMMNQDGGICKCLSIENRNEEFLFLPTREFVASSDRNLYECSAKVWGLINNVCYSLLSSAHKAKSKDVLIDPILVGDSIHDKHFWVDIHRGGIHMLVRDETHMTMPPEPKHHSSIECALCIMREDIVVEAK